MKQWTRYLVIFLLGGLTAFGFRPTSSVSTAQVARVIDGDTVDLADGRRVRYIGIDAPETEHEKKPASCFGKEAKEENRRLVDGKTVRIEGDVSETDKYGRLLRYVYVGSPAGEFVNDYLVRQGFARIDTVPPDVKFQQKFLEAQREAKGQRRGLWAKCINPTNPDQSDQ